MVVNLSAVYLEILYFMSATATIMNERKNRFLDFIFYPFF